MIKIQGSNLDFSLSIVIDNEFEFPLEHLAFESLQLSSNVGLHVPHGKMTFADPSDILKRYPLGDGHSMKFTFKFPETDEKKPDYEVKMRVFRIMATDLIALTYYTVFLVYDAPRFINENMKGSIKGSSISAIRQLAEDSKLDFSFNNGIKADSSDQQVWLPSGDKRCVFARKILQASWIDNKSCMQMGVNLNGTLVLKNVVDKSLLDKQVFVFSTTSVPVDKREIPIKSLQLEPFSKSGSENFMSGYKSITLEQNPTLGKSGNQGSHDKVSASVVSDSVSVNKNVNEGISGSNVRFAPINCGNTHKNYEKALHQNKRLWSLFSSGLRVVTDDFSDTLGLLDYVRVDSQVIRNNKPEQDKAVSGFYLVTGVSMFIKQTGQHFCKYEMVRQGVNNIQEFKSQSGIEQ